MSYNPCVHNLFLFIIAYGQKGALRAHFSSLRWVPMGLAPLALIEAEVHASGRHSSHSRHSRSHKHANPTPT